VDELVLLSRPPTVPAETAELDTAGGEGGGGGGGAISTEASSSDADSASTASVDRALEEMKEAGDLFRASAYLIDNQPRHRMMNTLTAGLGMLKALGGKR